MELHDAEEPITMRKILAHNMRTKKNPQIQQDTLWIFSGFQGVARVQSPTCTPARKFHRLASLTPKQSICSYFFEYFVLIDFFLLKKTLTLIENLLNFNGKICRFQSFAVSKKSPCQMFGRFLNVHLKSILMSLYYQYHELSFLLGSPLSI